MEYVRCPRFTHDSAVAQIELTERHRKILCQMHRHRFPGSHHIIAMIGDSRQHVLRRLQLICRVGYLERPRAQIHYYHQGGSRAIAFGLGNQGAARLKREFNLPFHRLDWSIRNRSAGRLFLEHALLISDILVAFELACHRHGVLRLLTSEELTLPAAAGRPGGPFKWNVNFGG